MNIPPPWKDDVYRKLPKPLPGTFTNVFWSTVSAYTGGTAEGLLELLKAGAALNFSVASGAGNVCDDVRPVIPNKLEEGLGGRAIVPMEDLPPVNFCENTEAVEKIRIRCIQYTQCLSQLLHVTRSCCGSWGRLHRWERSCLRKALAEESARRFDLAELCSYFVDLRLCNKGIEVMTADISHFSNLTKLVLSNNPKLTSIPFLPPACLVFIACGCSIREICGSSTLSLLGLAFNAMEDLAFIKDMPALRVLDLTRNAVFDMALAIDDMRGHAMLNDVTLAGCPIALLDDYRGNVTRRCPRLRKLDGTVISSSTKPSSVFPGKPSGREGASNGQSCATTPRELSTLMSVSVPMTVTVARLEGVSRLFHSVLARDDRQSLERVEVKPRKGKRKAKAVPVPISYEMSTNFFLKGSWGGEGGIVLHCESPPIVPAVAVGRPSAAQRKSLLPSADAVDNVMELNHTSKANIPISANLSTSLAQALVVTLVVRDEVLFPSGNRKTLTCEIGTFVVDCSSLLLDAGPPPRTLSVRVPLTRSKVALDEKRVHARELRKNVTDSLQQLTVASHTTHSPSPALTTVSVLSRRRSRKSASDRMSVSDRLPPEVRRVEDELDERRLLSNIEEKRVEELSLLETVLTLELALGAAPGSNHVECSTGPRGSRRRPVTKGEPLTT